MDAFEPDLEPDLARIQPRPPPTSTLAPWASRAEDSRGRRHAEPEVPDRDAFQRDRDRIVHSTAFRRLVYKTQVFVNHEGDLFRTRLTHSIEVAQIARSIARGLGLNADLVEAITLAHDLGHTPFGHAGQDALNACMRPHGGFEHNLQSLRVVDVLELRYAGFDGLNLCFETREGILKHCSRRDALALEDAEPGGVGRRFLDGTQPSLEAQLVDLADAITYTAHDLDDGVRSGLLAWDEVAQWPLVGACARQVLARHPDVGAQPGRRLLYETVRRLLSAQVHDVIAATAERLAAHAPADAQAARRLPRLVDFSGPLRAAAQALRQQLFRALYRHPQVMQTSDIARTVVADLFAHLERHPERLPAEFLDRAAAPRAVADYLSGMTDRYATRMHHALTGRDAFAPAADELR